MKRNTIIDRDGRGFGRRSGTDSRFAARAFTLVELLVVIAITSILLFLLFGPIISSFNLTRKARAVSQAQDAARFGLERLTRELGRATYIYDNGLSPVAIPMAYDNVASQNGTFDVGDPADPYTPAKWPTIAYARIDLAQPAVRQDGSDIIDPTTGQPVGGAELRPGVRGKRVTRYFLGLRFPGIDPQTNRQRLYQNRYEFRRIDNDNNPVILYRAEYDPTDGNLFDKDAADYSSTASNSGGFNDPAFFYATKTTDPNQRDAEGNPTNGRSYGENWQAIAQPVLVSESVDLLRWNRVGAATNRNEKDRNDPFNPTTTFSPVAVPDDVAAPGYLTSGGVETAASVPSQYQTKYAAWTYPYTITVTRGSTNYGPSRPAGVPEPFGQITLTVDRDQSGNVLVRDRPGQRFESSGTLATNTANGEFFALYSPTTRKLFVKTPRLTFAVDADRGRIETAFPPLMGIQNGSNVGVPYFIPAGTNAAAVLAPLAFNAPLTAGDVIPTFFSIDTRHPQAGTGTAPNVVPTNLGIFEADLFSSNYRPVDNLLGGTLSNASPLLGFGERVPGVQTRGVRIIPGSERLTAPVSIDSDGVGTPTAWTRIGVQGGAVLQPPSDFEQAPATAPVEPRFTQVPERKPFYFFDFDLYPSGAATLNEALFTFDRVGDTDFSVNGKKPSGMAASRVANQSFLTATYLWQNNYSRNPCTTANAPCNADLFSKWGQPLDATGAPVNAGEATRPEADIFRVDYATRQQYTISLGARIYDPTDGRAQTIQVSDKVIINNVLR